MSRACGNVRDALCEAGGILVRVALDKSGTYWRGEDVADLAEFMKALQSGGYPPVVVTESVCGQCGGRAFKVAVDAEQGCAQRVCVACQDAAFIADSAEFWEDADPAECVCPCGGGEFAVAIGFALREGGEVRWISVGLRCLTDSTLGVWADWKIDYEPTGHLLSRV